MPRAHALTVLSEQSPFFPVRASHHRGTNAGNPDDFFFVLNLRFVDAHGVCCIFVESADATSERFDEDLHYLVQVRRAVLLSVHMCERFVGSFVSRSLGKAGAARQRSKV